MAITGFPANNAFKVLNTGVEEDLGTLQPGVNQELKYIRLWVYIHGTYGGSETLTLKLYSPNGTLLHTSDTVTLSGITNIGTNWLGWLRFDFNRENISSTETF
ncbi:MAG: hypothetical protein PVJ60_10225, partial [Phycisphaerales bacterium]